MVAMTNKLVAFSQRDSRWSAQQLGAGEYTLGQAGCLVTAVASMLSNWDIDTDPARLNIFLTEHNGYASGDLYKWDTLSSFGVRATAIINCGGVPAPIELLASGLSDGLGLIAEVDWNPGGPLNPHFVWVISLNASNGVIVDPWALPGQEMTLLDTYLAANWTPARGLFYAALYSQAPTGVVGMTAKRRGHQKALCVRED